MKLQKDMQYRVKSGVTFNMTFNTPATGNVITFFDSTNTVIKKYSGFSNDTWHDYDAYNIELTKITHSKYTITNTTPTDIDYNYLTFKNDIEVEDGIFESLIPYTNNYNRMPYGSFIYNNLDGTTDICQDKGTIQESIVQRISIDDTQYNNNCPVRYIKVSEDCLINNTYSNPYNFSDTIRIVRYTDGTTSVALRTGNTYNDDSFSIIAGSSTNKVKAIEFNIYSNVVANRDPDIAIVFNNKTILVGLSSSSYAIVDPWNVNPLLSSGISAKISHSDLRNGLLEQDIGNLTNTINNLTTDIIRMSEELKSEFNDVKQLYVSR